MVLGLLLIGNAYAASENIYLTCPQNITEDNSDEFMREYNESKGKISQYWYFDIKKNKSKVKIKIYSHGWAEGKAWHEVKPEIAFDSKDVETEVYYENGEYKLNSRFEIKDYFSTDNFKIYKLADMWIYDGHSIQKSNDMNIDYLHKGKCNVHEKKKFNKLRKNGVSVN